LTGETRFRRRKGVRKVYINIEEHATNPHPNPVPGRSQEIPVDVMEGGNSWMSRRDKGVGKMDLLHRSQPRERSTVERVPPCSARAYSVLARFEDIVTT
jgi:hypothetical protein